MYPDHLKKVILGPVSRVNAANRKIFLKDIETVRAHNLVRLKGFTKGRLYQASIHGKAEVIQEIMRAYDRQAMQQLYAETGIIRSNPTSNFYLSRAYYILRNRGPWLKSKLTPELLPVKHEGAYRFSRFVNFGRENRPAPDSNSSEKASTPFHIWDFNYRLFVRRMTSVEGSQHERDWGVEAKDPRPTVQKTVLGMVESFEARRPRSWHEMFPIKGLTAGRPLEEPGEDEELDDFLLPWHLPSNPQEGREVRARRIQALTEEREEISTQDDQKQLSEKLENKDGEGPYVEPVKTSSETPDVEIWKPNQRDAKSRSEMFSAMPPTLAASLQKDINSEWTPHKWNELNLYPSISPAIQTKVLNHLHRSQLTDTQSLAIPILTKLDNEGISLNPKLHPELRQTFLLAAETGTGKTLAYLAPMLNKLKNEEEWARENPDNPRTIFKTQRTASPRAMILCPTAELAEQIYKILKKLCHDIRFIACAILPKYSDAIIRNSFLSKRIDVLVSTPARLLKFIESNEIKTNAVSYLIIDEADTLLDRSFLAEVNDIVGRCRAQLTHLVFVSATIPIALERMLQKEYPTMQRIVTPKIHCIPRRLEFAVSIEEEKLSGLYDLLTAVQKGETQKDTDVKRAIVFCNHKERVKEVYEYLVAQEEAVSEHREPGLELIPFTRQNYDRFTAMSRFEEAPANSPKIRIGESDEEDPKHSNDTIEDAGARRERIQKKLRVLITTDIGSRGLDTITARLVVLYDVPFSNIDLIHRLGRTARAGTRGRAVMLLTKKEAKSTVAAWINDVRDKIIRGAALA
jgi:ATP-dependent RNA helicase MRH4, mitochondrial